MSLEENDVSKETAHKLLDASQPVLATWLDEEVSINIFQLLSPVRLIHSNLIFLYYRKAHLCPILKSFEIWPRTGKKISWETWRL